MTKRSVLDFNRPRLFSQSRLNRVLDGNTSVINKNYQDLVETNAASTASFRYDPPYLGIRSTQQIPVDFSQFKNHTFFNSAEVNVNVAFDRIINEYPFDGSRQEVEAFLDSLTGFEKYVFDSFPRNVGYLFFSGSGGAASTEGSYIIVRDFAGNLYPELSKVKTGDGVLDPVLAPFTVELQLFVPAQANDCQIVCQKMSGSQQGITLALSQSASTSTCNIVFGAVSSSLHIEASAAITKGQFNHVVATLDRRPGTNDIKLYVNETLAATSSNSAELGPISFIMSPMTVGSGTTHSFLGTTTSLSFVPRQTLSGAIDELRVFHNVRTIKEQQLFAKKAIFSTPDLKLYFKFNEPTGSIGPNDIVLDSSGNSLHSRVSNFAFALRNTSSINVPMTYEKLSFSPVLFPAATQVQLLNSTLLASASDYDEFNPNLITKLIPGHYFAEGQVFESLHDESGTVGDAVQGAGPPGTADVGSPQLMASFLYVWAKFYDELKMVLDLFSAVIHVDYDKPGFTADNFLPFVASYFGFEMPAFFIDSSIEQFIDAENTGVDIGTSAYALQYVQNQIWRRILTNLGEIIRSKGTLHSIKSLFRSMGIDPDSNFRVREFGGPTSQQLTDAREPRQDIGTLVSFTASLAPVSTAVDAHTGFPVQLPLLMSPFLSGSRVEPGFPPIVGSFVQVAQHPPVGISNDPRDGLFTSGSWTYEALYRFPSLMTGSHVLTQSLVRLAVSGAAPPSLTGGMVANLTAVSGSNLMLHVRQSMTSSAPTLQLILTGVDVMDGKQWNVSFGRQRNDEIGAFSSSSFFLRAARQDFGDLVRSYSTSSLFFPSPTGLSVFSNLTGSLNASGSFLLIGSQSILDTTSSLFLNSTSSVSDSRARATAFDGRVGQVRFWSKALTYDEWSEHVKNFRSVGVLDPTKNFNFATSPSGSFQRLRLDVSAEQPTTMSNPDGTIQLFDFTQNRLHMSGTGFEASAAAIVPERFFFSQLSPRFDEASSNNKVRVRGFQQFSNVQLLGGEVSPVYEVPRSEQPTDDTRFSIDFSVVDALNEDIVRMFSTFTSLDNVLGDPELVFSPDYPGLATLRSVYFNRLTSKVRLRQFFEFFKWFDSVLGISTLVEQLIPRKTSFLGTNFVIESHMLERPKFEYVFSDIYLGENDRHGGKGTILLQQLTAILKRY